MCTPRSVDLTLGNLPCIHIHVLLLDQNVLCLISGEGRAEVCGHGHRSALPVDVYISVHSG